MSTMHSAGQQARRATIRRQARDPPPLRGSSSAPVGGPPPVAGGIAVTDLIILTISGVLALIRSLPLAELFDFIVATAFSASRVVAQTVWFHVRSSQVPGEDPEPADSPAFNSPFPPSSNHNIIKTSSSSYASSAPRRRHHRRRNKAPAAPTLPAGSSDFFGPSSSAHVSGLTPMFSSSIGSEDTPVWMGGSSPPTASHGPLPGPLGDSTAEMSTRPLRLDVSSSSDVDFRTEESTPSIMTAAGDARMTLFHHVVLVLTRFACENFPFLIPRIVLAEETIAPFVRWRTGGGAGALIREYGPDDSSDQDTSTESSTNKPFRAYWIGGDSHLTPLERRTDPMRRQATTIMWIHGGGFIMGSVAFYAESLLRILAKVCAIEHDAAINSDALPPYPEARCIAVEYSLGPNARFPQALLECLRTYAHLVEVEEIDPESIVLAGDSAGGNLALAMVLAISGQGNDPAVWDERDWTTLPLPSKALLVSPWIDLRPQHALAFESLRAAHPASPDVTPKQSTSKTSSQPTPEPTSQPTPDSTVSPSFEKLWSVDQSDDEANSDGSTITMGSEDPGTDYVVPEGLLHYAQVYTGVLDTPRRVNGPAGWIAGLLRTLDTQSTTPALETPLPEASKKGVSGLGRSLSSAVLQVLDAPLFERSSPSAAVVLPTDAYFGMNPLYGPSERASDSVNKRSQLYEYNLAFGSGGEAETTQTEAQLRAAEVLADEPFLSPAAGDWSNIELTNGIVVVYGSHELLAPDIRRWCQASGAQSVVQHGPTGVHAWPLVNMYIAGTPSEREKGIEILAHALARPRKFDTCTPVPPYGYSPAGSFPSGDSSPGSMPSDTCPDSPDRHGLSIDAPPMVYPPDNPFPLFGDTPSEATPSSSSVLSNSDGEEEDSNKLSGTPLHTYPPTRSSAFPSSGPTWWAGVAAPAVGPSTRPFTLDPIDEHDSTAPAPPVANPFVPSQLDGLSDITEETEVGSASSRPELVSRAGSGVIGRTVAIPTATTTTTTGRAMGSPRSEATSQLQGLGSAGDRLRAYLAEGPSPNASAPPVTRTRRRPAGGDVWW